MRGSGWYRWGGALLLVGAMGVLFEPVAAGEPGPQVTTTVLLTQSNWYWREQATDVGGTGVSPPTPLSDPTVPPGDLVVAGPDVSGQPDKESYVEFDVSAIPAGSKIVSFVVSLPVDRSARGPASQPVTPPFVACAPEGAWSGGPGAQSFSGKPSDRCAADPPKFTSKDGGKTYRADVTSLAQSWVEQGALNTGLAVTNDPADTQSAYQVTFGPARAISQLTAAVSYVPGSPAAGNATSSAQGGAASFAAPGADLTSSPLTAPPAGSAAVPAASSTTEARGGNGGAGRAVRATLSSASAVPPGGFWVIGVLLLALLLAVSLVLGDDAILPTARRPRRLAALLAGRRAGSRQGRTW